jgi:2-polyprenyl-3-methyl-5-hydroxy-6-metoxy-1,4-benzoquinol methylase
MMGKILEVYKVSWLLRRIGSGINYFLLLMFGVRLVKNNSIVENPAARKVFSRCSLKYSNHGFFYLDPMPSTDQLDEYYGSLYWGSRSGKTYGVNTRDLVHFNILKSYVPQYLSKGKVFLNFGAGHGGVSNLCWLDGMEILNIEPSKLPQFYESRWKTLPRIADVEDQAVDVIYGSHSLEHVQDIEKFKKEIERVLKPNGILFWEVPNADCPTNGACNGRVDIPHTYYFKADFFRKWYKEVLLCESYEQSQKVDVIERWYDFKDSKGSVVRALGRIN